MKKIIYLFFFLFFLGVVTAEVDKVDIDFYIIQTQIHNAYVVGDTFHYKINITNRGENIIKDKIRISVYNPNNFIIEKNKEYQIKIKPSENQIIKAQGGKKGEFAIFPFDISGGYRIEVVSGKNINFYRRWNKTYIRDPKNISYYFDVMPRWEYILWEDDKKLKGLNKENNRKLLLLNQKIAESNKTTTSISIAMAIIAFITLVIGIRASSIAKKAYETPIILEKEKEKRSLVDLKIQASFILKASQDQQEELKKIITNWKLPNINIDFFLQNLKDTDELKFNIKEKGKGKYFEIKEIILKLQNKIENINNIMDLIYQAYLKNDENKIKLLNKMIIEEKHHEGLNILIKNLLNRINKLESS